MFSWSVAVVVNMLFVWPFMTPRMLALFTVSLATQAPLMLP